MGQKQFFRQKQEFLQQQSWLDGDFQIKANKKLGQHFLTDKNLCDRIALSCGNLSEALVIEVGPGTGQLTQSLLALHPGLELLLIEKDTRFLDLLDSLKSSYKNNIINIKNCDALSLDWSELVNNTGKSCYIFGNLPYNIGTELLFRWLEKDLLKRIKTIAVMLQKEVVERVIAKPHSKNYSWLSIIAQVLCEVELVFDIEPEVFDPPPKVMSSLLTLHPRLETYQFNHENLSRLCHHLFMNRRKTINKIIKNNSELDYLLSFLKEIKFDLTQRPEDLELDLLVQLSQISRV